MTCHAHHFDSGVKNRLNRLYFVYPQSIVLPVLLCQCGEMMTSTLIYEGLENGLDSLWVVWF